jgi:cyclopropane-fatty-acyl-phospholipid synthase
MSSPRPAPTGAAAVLRPVLTALLGDPLPIGVRLWDGSSLAAQGSPTLVIHNRRALHSFLWAPGELGFARAFVRGDMSVDGDLFAFIDALNQGIDDDAFELRPREWLRLGAAAVRLGAVGPRPKVPDEEHPRHRSRLHSRGRDAAAVRHHYDVSNAFYRRLLGPSLVYSCAYWSEPGMSLEDAQEAKLALVARKLGLEPGMRLLDVGCGWGSMAIHAARLGCEVVGITLSPLQAGLAAKRAAEAGVAGQVDIRVQDYREITDGPFDAISSIGMSEHVGLPQLPAYFGILHGLLRPGGRLLNHAISKPGAIGAVSPDSFAGRYVFPDGELVQVGRVATAMEDVGLEVRDVEGLREHYAKTTRAWVANLQEHWDEAVAEVGIGRVRVWLLYLAASAVQFERWSIAIHQVLAVRPGADGTADLPATRAGWA